MTYVTKGTLRNEHVFTGSDPSALDGHSCIRGRDPGGRPPDPVNRELLCPSIPHRDVLLNLADEVVVVILRAIQDDWRVAAARLESDAVPVSHELQMTNRLRAGAEGQ